MPETNKERLIFLLMMSAAMTIGMESYNLILMHASGAHLLKAIAIDFPLMMITVMITQRFVAGPAAMRLAQSFLPEKPSPFRRMVTVSTCTVLLMCPLMSLAATLYFKRELGYIPSVCISRKTVYTSQGKSIELNPGQSAVYTKRAENGVRSGLIRDDGRRSMQCACVCVRPGASAHK